MATNASSLVNFGATTQSMGDWMYSEYAMPSPGYLLLNSDTASYLASSYPVLAALVTTPVTAYAATARTLPTSASWQAVAYGNNTFVAVSNGTAAATSPDGITWTTRTLPSSNDWRSVTFGNGVFVAVAYISTAALTSPDGITWTARTLPSADRWTSVTYGNGDRKSVV